MSTEERPYPSYKAPALEEVKEREKLTHAQKLFRRIAQIAIGIFFTGTAFGVGIGYSIWG